nr:hypothetical protein BaRGS_004504 [Batillaria attramentaria]
MLYRRTRMRTSDTLGTVVALRILIVLWMCVGRTRGQGLPTPDHDNDDFFSQGHGHQHQDHHRHLFFYNRLLPNGQEMKQYFLKNKPEKLFFRQDDDYAPLVLIVTPCASPINVSLYRNPLPPDQNGRNKQKGSDPFLERTLSIQRNKGAPVPLGNWSGETRMTYTDERARAGMYVLEITSTQSDSNVFVLATLSPVRAAVYPALPPDPHVKVKAVSRGAVTFGWPDAGPENPGRNLEYCISVSRGRKFGTHCSLIAHAKGDEKPKFTKDDFWGFTGEKERAREFRRKAKPVKAMPSRKIFHQKQKYCLYYKEASQIRSLKRHRCTQMDARPKSERVMCTRYRNRDVSKAVMSKTITKLKPDTQYVLDVYLSKRHSGPVAYKTVKVRTKPAC